MSTMSQFEQLLEDQGIMEPLVGDDAFAALRDWGVEMNPLNTARAVAAIDDVVARYEIRGRTYQPMLGSLFPIALERDFATPADACVGTLVLDLYEQGGDDELVIRVLKSDKWLRVYGHICFCLENGEASDELRDAVEELALSEPDSRRGKFLTKALAEYTGEGADPLPEDDEE